MHDLDTDLLRCFVTVADDRNFTVAGARLGRSQSAISVRIKKLEDLLGGQLLLRNNQGVSLTEKGKALYPRAKQILNDSERLLAEMARPSVSGRLRIGFLEYVSPHRIPDLLASVQRQLPDADLSFRVGLSRPLLSALKSGELDLALALHDPDSETSAPIIDDPLVWVGPSELQADGAGDTLALCMMQAPCIYRQAALKSLSDAGTAYREVLTCRSIQSVRSAVMSGLGVSVLGRSCLGEGLKIPQTLQQLGELPVATLSLHGSDPRKPEISRTLKGVFRDILD
ncbi:LysR family transcriptional regulator [Roseibium sp. MMSF_3412]|uniref:LysR family transcriptional regulator n=1 Tax=Roseibium sp. MMSF_3412 TaxID=3046712 RepID=UPI00273F828E|nr:LysR family transcriptional regulator [Roseibium sp. MMSF_3412]